MKKILNKTWGVLLLLLLTMGLTACGEGHDGTDSNQPMVSQANVAAVTSNDTQALDATPQHSTGQPNEQTLEELGAIIVAAGTFWDDWWHLRGSFAWEHIGDSSWYYWVEQPEHPRSRGYSVLLPSSGYETITDIALHLQHFYTDIWVRRELFGDRTVVGDFDIFFGSPDAFEEYDGVLYIATSRWGAMRPDWTTATHTLISQNDNIAVVETLVTAYDHRGSGDEMPVATFRFVFYNGRIENGLGHWEWPDSPQVTQDEARRFDPVADLDGTWTNNMGESITFPWVGYEFGTIARTPNGAYVLEMIWLEGGEMRLWVFPVGVEMIRYNALGARMYNESVVSDTSQVRLFTGDFEVTSCCTDEAINQTIFTR